ncbi:MAG: hypothetical protein J6I45_01170 [Clostridia bacterium]|nr:hypothetical protein [Clostridia bacterium]
MKDLAHERTDAAIANLELELREHYRRAADELIEKGKAYFEKFRERDREMRGNLKKGRITEEQYKKWRITQIARGKRFDALADRLAMDAAQTDVEAMAIVKGELPDIFALNYNYTAYTIEQAGADVDFSLYDRATVENLMANNPDILPDPSPKLTRDMLWNRKHIAAEITTAILQGEDIGKVAERLRNVTDMDERASKRNARTAMTSAQNSGRQHNYEKAAALGIKVRKKWIATLDGRTRHEHGMMDGQIVDYDKPFHYGPVTMMFPGDMTAPPWMVYNCRCRVVTVEKEGIIAEPVMRRMRNPVTGRNELVSDMTYDEWVKAKEAAAAEETDTEAVEVKTAQKQKRKRKNS